MNKRKEKVTSQELEQNYHLNNNYFSVARRGVFHYCVMAHLCAENENRLGEGEIGGDMFVIYDGRIWFGEAEIYRREIIFTHELGHNILGYLDSSHSADQIHCNSANCVMYGTASVTRWKYCANCLAEIDRDGLLGLPS